ncbi:MAG: CHAT domain-containing protein [Acidobacteriota bacterium]|nr:CHAT domain-containing protein [Acidobacteriota bacterium]
MKLNSIVLIVLCTVATTCTPNDTGSGALWPSQKLPRSIEPQLSIATEWRPCAATTPAKGNLLSAPDCGKRAETWRASCADLHSASHHDTALAVLSRHDCLDDIISRLETLAEDDPKARVDLAAAYLVRAQNNHAADFLNAWTAAKAAVDNDRDNAAARFNLALAQESLGLTVDAISSLNAFLNLDVDDDWAAEARVRRDRLDRRRIYTARADWEKTERAIENALTRGDSGAVQHLIRPYPAAAERMLYGPILGRWAAAPTPQNLNAAALLADALSKRIQDPLPTDVIAAIRNANPAQLKALCEGHGAFASARAARLALNPDAGTLARDAATQLLSGGSPLALFARLEGQEDPTLILDEAERRNYRSLRARALFTRGSQLASNSDVFAIVDLTAALRLYEQIDDKETIAAVLSNRASVFRMLAGNPQRAWDDALRSVRVNPYAMVLKTQHIVLGEAALTARELGFPRVALLYHDNAVHRIRAEIASTDAGQSDAETIQRMQSLQLVIALQNRAPTLRRTGQLRAAAADLAEAARYAEEGDLAQSHTLVTISQLEAEGQAALGLKADEAVAKFKAAVALAETDPLKTYRAALYAQLARALRSAGRNDEARQALIQARNLVRTEEKRVLANRDVGRSEQLWRTYFSRFNEPSRSLVEQYIESNSSEEAFLAAEEVRGIEPLDLILKRVDLPRAFRTLAENPEARTAAKLREFIPAGKVVLYYSVQNDRTFIWLLTRDRFELLEQQQRVGREDITRWASALQQAENANNRRSNAVSPTDLREPYEALFADPLKRLRSERIDASQLVIVPDGPMHALPFAALYDGQKYLIEHASIEVAESLLLYAASVLQNERPSTDEPDVFLIGNPALDPEFRTQFKPLAAAEEEVNEIAREYGASAHKPLIRGEATIEQFLANVPQSTVVHLAAHAVVNQDRPEKSILLLAPAGENNGALDAETLMARTPRLNETRLVVLAACSTAGGLPVGSGGLAPLVRPFITAGVPAVIGTLWEVGDATTKQLMVSFHREYRQGRDAAAALRAAQQQMLRGDRWFLRALTWGAFQVIGHGSSPFAHRHENDKGEPP